MISDDQRGKYFSIWREICEAQGWTNESKSQQDQRRYALMRKLGLPDSLTKFSGKHFGQWINRTAALRNTIDIRDRERESVVWTIERFREAFMTLLGRDYVRTLMIAWGDTTDLDNFSLEHASQLDLVNLRNTLKNRLGRVIQRIRDGELQPGPDCPNFGNLSQADIIHALVHNKPVAAPTGRRQYALNESKTFQARDGMEYGTADVPATSRPPVAVPPSKPAPPPPAAAQKGGVGKSVKPTVPRADTVPAGSNPAPASKYCMH